MSEIEVDVEVTTHLKWGCGYATAKVEGWPVGRYIVLFGLVVSLGWR